jgi:hypothetical protein
MEISLPLTICFRAAMTINSYLGTWIGHYNHNYFKTKS